MPKLPWWQTVFDEKYLDTYVDILTPERTAKQIGFVTKLLKRTSKLRVLDLACGHGRHSLALARQGYYVTGVDFSKTFIDLAKKQAKAENLSVDFVRNDMRKIRYAKQFDVVLNLFTSFGYFEKETDHSLILRNISNALKPGGTCIIDINNSLRVLSDAVKNGKADKKTGQLIRTSTDSLSNGITLTTDHTIDPATMRWSMKRTWKEGGKKKEYTTEARMFTLPELTHLMEENGLHVTHAFGGFDGSSFQTDSPRLIIIATKQ